MNRTIRVDGGSHSFLGEPFTTIPCVAIVDDDALVLKAIAVMLAGSNVEVEQFSSLTEFERRRKAIETRPGCALIDLRLDDEEGIHLIQSLGNDAANRHRPNILISGFADVAKTVEAMKLGCWTVLQKPLHSASIRTIVQGACDWSVHKQPYFQRLNVMQELWATINPEERDTILLILDGLPNKNVARQLDVSVRTIENRRSRIFDKLGISSTAQLGTFVTALGETGHRPAESATQSATAARRPASASVNS